MTWPQNTTSTSVHLIPTHQSLEGQLAEEQLGGPLVAADVSEGDRAGPVAVGLLHAHTGGGGLTDTQRGMVNSGVRGALHWRGQSDRHSEGGWKKASTKAVIRGFSHGMAGTAWSLYRRPLSDAGPEHRDRVLCVEAVHV